MRQFAYDLIPTSTPTMFCLQLKWSWLLLSLSGIVESNVEQRVFKQAIGVSGSIWHKFVYQTSSWKPRDNMECLAMCQTQVSPYHHAPKSELFLSKFIDSSIVNLKIESRFQLICESESYLFNLTVWTISQGSKCVMSARTTDGKCHMGDPANTNTNVLAAQAGTQTILFDLG